MQIRRYQPSDYSTLCSWWDKYDHVRMPERYLSDVGFIVDDHACLFVYETKSVLVWLEHMIANKDKTKQERHDAINLILETIVTYCQDKGYEIITTGAQIPSLKSIAKNNGFTQYPDDVNLFFKGVYKCPQQ